MRIGRFAVSVLAMTLLPALADASVRCMTREIDPMREQVRAVAAEQMIRTHVGEHPMTPPDNPDVGDSWLWYTWRLNGPPTPELKMCTVRGEGQSVYVVVENSQWLTRVFQDDIDAVVEAWDNSSIGPHPDQGIYEINTTHFGPAPDALDNDPKIYVLFYDFDVNADGFFWYFDQYPDGSQPYASNECEVLYINCSDFDPGGEYLIAVMAHEFEHQIHWLADENEVAWVDEGMGELAMWLYGNPDTISSFPGNPDNDLTTWNGAWADYIKTYLWSLYFYEQFGGQQAVWTLMQEQGNSNIGYDNALDTLGSPLSFNDAVANWTCANYLDDPSLAQGQYGYRGETLPTFYAMTKSAYPVPPNNGSVLRYAADYVKFINPTGPQLLRFDGTDIGVWKPRALFYQAGVARHVADIPLDAVDAGSIPLYGFGTDYDMVVLVIAKMSPASTTSYQYLTENASAAALDGTDGRGTLRLAEATPNPMAGRAGTVTLRLEASGPASIRLLDPAGRLVRTLQDGWLQAGIHTLAWDGTDENGESLPGGVYFLDVRSAAGNRTQRWVIL